MPERAWFIPGDWVEERDGWRGVCIQWPNSWGWLLLLKSLLYTLALGRSWDKATGNIKATQAIGLRIFDAGKLFPPCGVSQDGLYTLDEIRASGQFGGVTIEGDEDMGQVVTEIKVENGKLIVYYGHCCFDEFDISGVLGTQGGAIPDGDDPVNPTHDPAFVYSACGKAAAIVNAVYLIIEAAFNAVTLPFPWQVIPSIENEVGYDLDNNWLYVVIADVTALTVASLSYEDVATDLGKQQAICNVVTLFDDDAVGVPTAAVFEEIKGAIKTANYGFTPMWELVDAACNALGRVDMDTISRSSAADDTQNCDCPEQPLVLFPGFGAGLDWVHVYDFRETLPGDFQLIGTNPHADANGLWSDPGGTDDKTDVGIIIPITMNTGTAEIRQVGMVFQTRGDENWDDAQSRIVGTENDTLISLTDVTNMVGENPSAAGIWQLTKAVASAITAGEPDQFRADIDAYHPPDTNPPAIVENSTVLIAIAFAGTGDDPRP
jgi:hypothetical protein